MPNYKVVDADVLDADLQTVADAIKAKAGTEEALEFPSGFASAVESIETGGGADHTMEDGLITGTLTEYTNDRVEEICNDMFSYITTLTSVNFPAAKIVGNRAFANCKGLESVNFPVAETLGQAAFSTCRKLARASFPSATSVDTSFAYCESLVEISLPKLTGISASNTFYGDKALKKVEFAGGASISSSAFDGCSVLDTLIIRSGWSDLSDVKAFNKTPFASGGTGGTVYVPAALIEQYQTATNWSTLYAAGTCNFVAIEGSEYE